MSYKLRQYQKDFARECLLALNKYKKVCASLPTGSGKTVIAQAVIELMLKHKRRVLFIVNREELVNQSFEKFTSFANKLSIIKSGESYKDLFDVKKPVQLVMIQTYYARRKRLPNLHPHLIICDEVHEGYSASRMRKLFDDYPNTWLLGLTATPIDERGYLLSGFNEYIQHLQVSDLQEMGFLCEDKCYAPANLKLDLKEVRIVGGDYCEKVLSQKVSEKYILQNIYENWLKIAGNKQTLIFAVDINHAEKIQEEFTRRGVNARVVHSMLKDPADRNRIVNMFNDNKIQVLINVSMFTTGFDSPKVECVILARPTVVERLYRQMVGRGLRIYETPYYKKECCIFLDCAGSIERFGMPSEDRYYEPAPQGSGRRPVRKEVETNSKLCQDCWAVNPMNARECRYCGASLVVEIERNFQDDELVLLEKKASDYQATLTMLKQLCEINGHMPGYGYYLLKDRLYPIYFQFPKGKLSKKAFYNAIQKYTQRAINKGRKPPWVVTQVLNHFKYYIYRRGYKLVLQNPYEMDNIDYELLRQEAKID